MRYLILILLSVLQTCTSAGPVPLTLSDEQQFIDLSAYNFYLGRNAVYEYILTARPGKQVNLYLFTNNVNQYDIKVYNGDNDQAPQIDIRANIPKNDQIVEYPVPIQSSGQKMFIVLNADQRNQSVSVDFQAMATDYTQKGCGQLVTSINPKQEEELSMKLTASKQGGNCYYVFHANDPTNTLTLTQRVTTGFNENSTVYTLYKGLHIDNVHSLVNYGQWWDVKATDKYIIFNPIADIGIGYSWYYTNYLATTHVWLFTHDSLMTVDYLQDGYPNSQYPIQQDFIVRMDTPTTAIQIVYLNLLGASSLKVTPFNGTTKASTPITYHSTDFAVPFNVTYTNCDSVEFKYNIDRQFGVIGGFYALVADATYYPILNPTNSTLHSTASPIQTTTNKSQYLFNFFIISIVTVFASVYV